eukprot:6212117-Prymnesium_polylepis.1
MHALGEKPRRAANRLRLYGFKSLLFSFISVRVTLFLRSRAYPRLSLTVTRAVSDGCRAASTWPAY